MMIWGCNGTDCGCEVEPGSPGGWLGWWPPVWLLLGRPPGWCAPVLVGGWNALRSCPTAMLLLLWALLGGVWLVRICLSRCLWLCRLTDGGLKWNKSGKIFISINLTLTFTGTSPTDTFSDELQTYYLSTPYWSQNIKPLGARSFWNLSTIYTKVTPFLAREQALISTRAFDNMWLHE